MIQIAPLIEIAPFHATYLLLIILLSSLKAETKSVLHSANFQSYQFAPPSPPLPQSYRAPVQSQFLSFKQQGERKIKEMGGKKKIRISTTIKQLLLTVQTIQQLACRAIAKNLKNLLALGSYQLALPICIVQRTVS